MHKLIGAVCRRTAGVAAGVILTGGLAGGVLLTTAGAASAAPPVPGPAGTSTSASATAQGSTINVSVSVSALGGTSAPAGSVSVSGPGGGCSAALFQGAGLTSWGHCSIYGVANGTYTLRAYYAGTPSLNSSSGWATVTVSFGPGPGPGPGPRPHPRPFPRPHPIGVNVNLSTSLSCPSVVRTNHRGTCTLSVTNWGGNSAPDVTAQIALPWQLRADYCNNFYFYNYGCTISGNTASENLGTLYRGQTKTLSVTFTASRAFNLFGWHPGNQFAVKVVGTASANGYGNWQWFGQRTSTSTAWVTILPWGKWW
jgi:hypothetical protein